MPENDMLFMQGILWMACGSQKLWCIDVAEMSSTLCSYYAVRTRDRRVPHLFGGQAPRAPQWPGSESRFGAQLSCAALFLPCLRRDPLG